jgi:hypothetical protein
MVAKDWLYIEQRPVGFVNRLGILAVGLALAVLLVSASAEASQPELGFVTYKVEATLPTGQRSMLVNETIGQSAKPGFSDLVLQLIGSQQNLTYSKLVNETTSYFPFLSSLASQSLDYSNRTTGSVNANFSVAGTTRVTFQGTQYTMNVFSFVISGSHAGMNLRVNGTMETFPSSLVYSLAAGNSTVSVQAVLVATDLPLNQASIAAPTAAYVGAGVGVGGIAIAAAFLVHRRDRKGQTQEQKPPHWVD